MTLRLSLVGVVIAALPTLLVMAMHMSTPYDNHNFFLGMLTYVVAIVPISIELAKPPDPFHAVLIDTLLKTALIYNCVIVGTLFGVVGFISDMAKRRK